MDKLFTAASFGTLATCTAAVVVIVNTTRHVFDWGPRWFALLLALLVAVVSYFITSGCGAPATAEQAKGVTYLIVLLNGCLLYTSSFGLQNTVIAKRAAPQGHLMHVHREALSWRSPW